MSTIKVDTIATRTGSGNITLSNSLASATVAGDLTVDTNTLIVDASENTVNINNNVQTMNAFADDLVIGDGSNSNGITIYTGTNDNGTVNFADGSSGSPSYQGYIQYNHTTNQFSFFADYATNGGTPRIVMPSAGGIAFNGDSAAANSLDDYEEGTWTPELSSGNSSTYDGRSGHYTKIGRQVIATFKLEIGSTFAGGTTQYLVGGLPFTAVSGLTHSTGSGFLHYYENLRQNVTGVTMRVDNNLTVMYFSAYASANNGLSVNANILQAQSNIYGTVVYITA